MNKHFIFILSAIFTFITLLSPSRGEARVYLDITSADAKKLSIAIPAFTDSTTSGVITEKGQKITDLMAKALVFHGFISVVPASSHQNRRDANWSALGADYVIFGSYGTEGNEMVIEAKLMDTQGNKMIAGKRYRTPANKARTTVLKLSDEIIFQLTGDQGVSNTKIAFVSDKTGKKEIYLADVLGDNIRQVTRHNGLCISPRFSPDGGRLAYTSYHRNNPNLYITDLSQDKTTKAISWQKGLNMAPAWSPDGQSLITTLSKDGNSDLYLMATTGKILERLTKNQGISCSASWSPDGRRFAFVSDRTGNPQIYIMDMGSRQVQRLTFSGKENTTPSWSPKGDLIAYTALTDNGYQLFIISPEGGEPTQLTQYWGNYESPSWSPDGRQIVLSRGQGANKELCRIFLKGQGLTTLFPMKGTQTYPQWSPRLPY
ncbi:MAG: Tol-Pal system beta propeller repeat protein TolB [Proteobacteria bacterium]|nr:Tol-Pal system beta propeller repeat protein TolB [Desulfobulbaceae bacterium]MBU4154033.1 Tol-Pal system beta propeller repeat protein TolB [Pseudomonadota bacterium]